MNKCLSRLFALALGALSTWAAMIVPGIALADSVKIAGDTPFWIDRTEVTIGRFGRFAAAANLTTAAEREGGGMEYAAGWQQRLGWTWQAPYGERGAADEPAVHVTWAEAKAYCEHVGGRLPTAKEWRLAAYTETREISSDGFRQGRTYQYPVGDDPTGMNNSRRRHVPVGTTKQGVNGLYDMGANVWEWLADRRGDEALTIGGSWWYPADMTQASRAQYKPADFAAIYIGFRCAYSRPPQSSGSSVR